MPSARRQLDNLERLARENKHQQQKLYEVMSDKMFELERNGKLFDADMRIKCLRHQSSCGICWNEESDSKSSLKVIVA
eukprot:9541027-Lingulodinium_polyedra.AAC.1